MHNLTAKVGIYSTLVGVQSIVINPSVCVSVCQSASISLEPLDQSSQNVLCRSCGHGSVLLWQRYDMLCTSCFTDEVTFGRNVLGCMAMRRTLMDLVSRTRACQGRVWCLWMPCYSGDFYAIWVQRWRHAAAASTAYGTCWDVQGEAEVPASKHGRCCRMFCKCLASFSCSDVLYIVMINCVCDSNDGLHLFLATKVWVYQTLIVSVFCAAETWTMLPLIAELWSHSTWSARDYKLNGISSSRMMRQFQWLVFRPYPALSCTIETPSSAILPGSKSKRQPTRHQGSHASWKTLEFFCKISRTWKVMKNDLDPGKT